MSNQERIWWSSPYLRMLASPIRQCILTDRYLPMDFMIRLAPMQLVRPPTTAVARSNVHKSLVLLPDGLQHPRFKVRRSGKGAYLVCWKDSLELIITRGKYKRLSPNLTAHPRLVEQVSHLLRLRVLQELQLVAEQLEAQYRDRRHVDALPLKPHPPLIRRLTRAEWAEMRSTGIIPFPGAMAVLVVPPVNRNPTTKTRPDTQDAMSPAPLAPSMPPPLRALPPLSVLHPTHAPPPARTKITQAVWDPRIARLNHPSWEQEERERQGADQYSLGLVEPTGRRLAGTTRKVDVKVLERWVKAEADLRRADAMEEVLAAAAAPVEVEVEVPPHAEVKVPLYNGVALFPSAVQRAKLHELLTRLLGVERNSRYSAGAVGKHQREKEEVKDKGDRQVKGDNKGSHAFLICSSHEADVGGIGVALWRIRMWEGGGWKKRSRDMEDGEGEEEWPWIQRRKPASA
ncbi:hypothetical protein B0H10DRAFT_2428536 [Mycena sp. CBHHK59/15]|nr:hypothetical protein B0H10DRAFT_2428536 [Mycena sp. CBHHK59/15]